MRLDGVENRMAEVDRAVDLSHGALLLEEIREREGLSAGKGEEQ
jgi:hypothetical protein